MNFSKSSQKRVNKVSFEKVSAYDMYYQLTYMSAMASAGISRSRTFELAALSGCSAADYFSAINTLVAEFRFDYPEACRRVGIKSKSDNMRSFLLRFSDALRSGEPLAEYLEREAHVQSIDYENTYERNVEAMKQWSNAFTSILISVALIVIIQVITSMIYSTDLGVMTGLVATGVIMVSFGAWIIWRSAPQEVMTVEMRRGSREQRSTYRLFRMMAPLLALVFGVGALLGLELGLVLMLMAVMILPIGVKAFRSEGQRNKKDVEFSTFLRSTGGMATASGTTLNESLQKIDLSSFPTLQMDVIRLDKRLSARVDPEMCWKKFGMETGSNLIKQVTDIFYSAIQMGGDPERVGYVCSLFTAKTTQLRAKRRLVTSTFSGLTTVMQAVVAFLMVFVLSIVQNFAALVESLMPVEEDALSSQPQMSLGMAEFTDGELLFLSNITVTMVLLLALVGVVAIVLSDGGFKLKGALYLAIAVFVAGLAFIVVPPMVGGILTV